MPIGQSIFGVFRWIYHAIRALFTVENLKFLDCFLTIGSFVAFVTLAQQTLEKINSENSQDPVVIQAKRVILSSLILLPVSLILPVLGFILIPISTYFSVFCIAVGILLCIWCTIGFGILLLASYARKPELSNYKHEFNSIGAMIIIFYILFIINMVIDYRAISKLVDLGREMASEARSSAMSAGMYSNRSGFGIRF